MAELKHSLAVVIEINEYQNGIARLKTAVPYAMAIATMLRDSYQYQLVRPDFETGIIVNQYVTSDRLKSLFTDLLPKQVKPTKSDRFSIKPLLPESSSRRSQKARAIADAQSP